MNRWKLIEQLSEEYAKVAGLTPMSLNVLSIIRENSHDCTQKLICRQSQYNKQSVNMIIKSFWEQGYVELTEMREALLVFLDAYEQCFRSGLHEVAYAMNMNDREGEKL